MKQDYTDDSTDDIPNIVHFVHLVQPESKEWPDYKPGLKFPLRQFIAIYSASYYLQPEIIYIHTNLKESMIGNAINNTQDSYARAVSKLPNVKFNHVIPDTHTADGQAIEKLAHQSDFIRTEQMKKYGGIYLDDDAYVLQDLKPFRKLGYENIVGKQADGKICNAVMMSSPKNDLMKAYNALQDVTFDGAWTTHSVDLLTTLAAEFANATRKVLILPQDTFFPSRWERDEIRDVYQIHDGVGEPVVNNKSPENLTDFIENFQLKQPEETWQRDWRQSYVLHGWTSGLAGFDDEARRELFGDYRDINLDYVLSERSNFGRAVGPAVQHALETGVLVHERSLEIDEAAELLT